MVNQVEEPSSLFFGSTGTIAIGKNAVEYLKIGGDSVSSFGLDRIDLFGDGHQYYGKYITPRIYRPLETAPDHQPTLLSNKLIYQIDLTQLVHKILPNQLVDILQVYLFYFTSI